jgi:hypothetical protein
MVSRDGGDTDEIDWHCPEGVGFAAPIAAVGADTALAEPFAFLAVTTTLIVRPTSLAPRRYVWLVSRRSLHCPPLELHRCHRYEYVIVPVPVQVPGLARRVSPWRGVPEIVGTAVFAGAAWPPAVTTDVGADLAFVDPSALVAVTLARRVFPTSF